MYINSIGNVKYSIMGDSVLYSASPLHNYAGNICLRMYGPSLLEPAILTLK